VLAGEIHRDLPDFTVHDITHLDALWEMADLIAGPEYPLNPMEAFALGAVFLIHDLGLGLAAYPDGLAELKKGTGWQDALSTYLRKHLERIPTAEELASPPPEVERMAVQERLRVLHAEQAERLALISWSHKQGPEYHLIEDPDLRQAIGPLLGRIAHSHWWPVSRLGNEFGTIRGALFMCPVTWTLDPLKIAVLLRTADAAHLDARRAPGFSMALRRPEGVSEDHWRFQNHLLKPRVEDDRLVYTTAAPFPPEEVNAWWLGEGILRMVDREFHQVDALLADQECSPRLRARGVAGVESPLRLQKYIGVSGWKPVDARLHVSNVAGLARKLGGQQLYGDDPTVPLRELIQNASDAVRARRLFESRGSDWGEVTVRLGRDEQGPWVEVEDTGIGMSEAVLIGPLLDFGMTYWGSELMREELEGLWAKGFEPVGQYGIGFFSVFILGLRVRVTTRRAEDGGHGARVLEFRTGLDVRPFLRPAKKDELLPDGGTRVRVWLTKEPKEKGGLLWSLPVPDPVDLGKLCAWLAPALDVNLYAENSSGKAVCVVGASDWVSINIYDLLARISINGAKALDYDIPVDSFMIASEKGKVLGRASLMSFVSLEADFFSPGNPLALGVIVIGGLRAVGTYSASGLFVGLSGRVSRDRPRVPNRSALARWASAQAAYIEKQDIDPVVQVYFAMSVLAFGGDPGSLPIVMRGEFWIDCITLAVWESAPRTVILFEFPYRRSIRYEDDVVLYPGVLGGRRTIAHYEISQEPMLASVVGDALAQAWKCLPTEIVVERFSSEYEVGVRKDGTVLTVSNVTILKKPR
jgi:hypothetical protein